MDPDPRADTVCKNVWWYKKLIETKCVQNIVQNIVQNLQVSSVWLLRPRRHINVRRTKFQYSYISVTKKFDSSVCLLQAWGNDKMHWLIAVDGDIVVFHNHYISLYSNICILQIYIYDMHGCYIHYTNQGICQTWETINACSCPPQHLKGQRRETVHHNTYRDSVTRLSTKIYFA